MSVRITESLSAAPGSPQYQNEDQKANSQVFHWLDRLNAREQPQSFKEKTANFWQNLCFKKDIVETEGIITIAKQNSSACLQPLNVAQTELLLDVAKNQLLIDSAENRDRLALVLLPITVPLGLLSIVGGLGLAPFICLLLFSSLPAILALLLSLVIMLVLPHVVAYLSVAILAWNVGGVIYEGVGREINFVNDNLHEITYRMNQCLYVSRNR